MKWGGNWKTQPAANPCNQFLIQYLQKLKKQSERVRPQRTTVIFSQVIKSIQKYPLPLICVKQLKMLHGVGDFLCGQLAAQIKSHYSAFLKEPEHSQSLDFRCSQISQQSQAENELDIDSNSQSNTLLSIKSQIELDKTQTKSLKASSIREYRPRPNSTAANILMKLGQFQQGFKACREKIKLEIQGKIDNRTLSLTLGTLTSNGYLLCHEEIEYELTSKGRHQIVELGEKHEKLKSKSKIKSLLSDVKSEPKQQSMLKGSKKSTMERGNQDKQLWLIIDSREVKDKEDRGYFETKLKSKYNVNCRVEAISIGDFLWMYGDNVLDFIVERKKADDLASSILDGRYKEQKSRLKMSDIQNIYYLFEGALTVQFAKYQREVESALISTRIRDQFRVVKTDNINESLKFLAQMHRQIQKDLSKTSFDTLGTLKEFNRMNHRNCQFTVLNAFFQGLRTYPGVGKNCVQEIGKFFRSYNQLYSKLEKLDSRYERIEFMKGLFKGNRVSKSWIDNIVDLLFFDKY